MLNSRLSPTLMNGGRLIHLTDEALQLVLLICMWHSAIFAQSRVTLYSFFFALWSALCLLMHSFCPTSSLKIWSLLLITLWVFVGALCYDYLLTLVMLQYHAHENRQRNSESGSSKCCAQTRNLESLSGIFLSSTLRVRPHCSQIKRSSANGDKYL